MDKLTRAEFDNYNEQGLTLDNKPAFIKGRCLSFPVVVQVEVSGLGFEFAPETIRRIMESGGNFKS